MNELTTVINGMMLMALIAMNTGIPMEHGLAGFDKLFVTDMILIIMIGEILYFTNNTGTTPVESDEK